MDNETIKQTLLQIQPSELDFSVIMTGKESVRVNGLYNPETREILLHNKNFSSDKNLIYTAIHEYTHHLINEEKLAESGGKLISQGRVHNAAFWSKFHMLLEKAEELGIYKIDLEESPELKEITEKIRKEYIEVNGKLMQEFGRLLAKAHELCQNANIRYEDYIDRVLCLPRNSARDITRVGAVSDINPSIGFDNMKMISAIKKSDERSSAQEKILSGESPATVRSLMKNKCQSETDPKQKLEKEKNRLTKTIAQLQQRLEFVEESLASM